MKNLVIILAMVLMGSMPAVVFAQNASSNSAQNIETIQDAQAFVISFFGDKVFETLNSHVDTVYSHRGKYVIASQVNVFSNENNYILQVKMLEDEKESFALALVNQGDSIVVVSAYAVGNTGAIKDVKWKLKTFKKGFSAKFTKAEGFAGYTKKQRKAIKLSGLIMDEVLDIMSNCIAQK